jgi:Fe-S oxidoreductase
MAARMAYCLRRMPTDGLLSPAFREQMLRIEDCTHCGKCHERCPYDIDAEELLPEMLADYEKAYAAAQ